MHIKKIQNSDGVWLEDMEKIDEESIQVFKSQFTQDEKGDNFLILNRILITIVQEDNILLCSLPNMDEVKNVVFYIEVSSVGRPDGLKSLPLSLGNCKRGCLCRC